jgi:bifunctional DNA-binding transcriptional regulator/antitoxin component of YhaV-PrlF toxin-antitoxin module
MTTTLSEKRQISIPKELCDQLQVQPGTRIAWEVEGNKLVGRPLPKDIIAALTGIHRDGPDLVAKLLGDRRKDREMSDRKLARHRGAVRAKRKSRTKRS